MPAFACGDHPGQAAVLFVTRHALTRISFVLDPDRSFSDTHRIGMLHTILEDLRHDLDLVATTVTHDDTTLPLVTHITEALTGHPTPTTTPPSTDGAL